MKQLLYLIALLLMMPAQALGFEIELERSFPSVGTEQRPVVLLSSTDLELMAPLIETWQRTRNAPPVRYIQASSLEVYKAVVEGEPVDLVMSSAMDLQTKLVNDGFAQTWQSEATASLPDWAIWRDQLIGFTEEPAVTVYSERHFETPPQNRLELISLIRANPDRFRNRIATYDPEGSGLGYLFATQDAQQGDVFWRLAEVIGGLAPQLSVSSAEMINQTDRGEILVAYNVLGSYAARRKRDGARVHIVNPTDYTLTMIRTALIPAKAKNIAFAGQFIDFLLSPEGRRLLAEKAGLPPVSDGSPLRTTGTRPIMAGPGLLVYLDRLKKRHFLRAWDNAISDR